VKIGIYKINGEKSGELSVAFNGYKISNTLASQVLRVYETNTHIGTRKAKNRGEIDKPDKKLWRQKGTGRARMGSPNSPIWVGGAKAHGPRAYTRRLTLPSQVKNKALSSFLADKLENGAAVIIEATDSVVKTKEYETFLKNLDIIHKKSTCVLSILDENNSKAIRNLRNVKIRRVELLNAYDVYNSGLLLFTKDAFEKLIKRLPEYEIE